MQSARQILAQSSGEDRFGPIQPLAMSVEALVVERPDGSYAVDITVARAGWNGQTGEVFTYQTEGMDGHAVDARSIPDAVSAAIEEVYVRLV
jgi:hypothetical protein